jgi:hypothetical protein
MTPERFSSRIEHRGKRRAGGDDLLGGIVERHDLRTAASSLEGMTTESRASIEHAVSRA